MKLHKITRRVLVNTFGKEVGTKIANACRRETAMKEALTTAKSFISEDSYSSRRSVLNKINEALNG